MTTPASTTRHESASQRYIRLLEQLERATESMKTGRNDSPDDVLGFAELRKSDLIEGVIDYTADGRMQSVQLMRITMAGRLKLDELRARERLSTSAGIWDSFKWKVYGWLLAILVGGIIGYFVKGWADSLNRPT